MAYRAYYWCCLTEGSTTYDDRLQGPLAPNGSPQADPRLVRGQRARGPWDVTTLSSSAPAAVRAVASCDRPGPSIGGAPWRRFSSAMHGAPPTRKTSPPNATAWPPGCGPDRIYVDHGLTGTNRERPGLREALAACRDGDTLVVTKLDRLARSLPDARALAEELSAREVRLSLGGSVYDPTDAVGRLLFNVLAMVAEFESDLIRLRTKEGCGSRRPRDGCAASSPS